MKARLVAALHTRNDARIFDAIWRKAGARTVHAYHASDRRDADLMWSLQEARTVCDQQGVLHCILAGYHTALAGYDDPDIPLVKLGLEMRIPKLPERYR